MGCSGELLMFAYHMEMYFILRHSVLIWNDRHYALPKNRCCSLSLIFEGSWVTNLCASVLIRIDIESKGFCFCWYAHMNDHRVYLFGPTERQSALLDEIFLNASEWCSSKKLLLQLLRSASPDSAQKVTGNVAEQQQYMFSEYVQLMGSQHEQTSCWQSSFKCQYSGHLGTNVPVCIIQCVHYVPLSCKSVGTKGCVTGFQASAGAVYDNLLSFNSWVLAGSTREIKTLHTAMPTCLLLMLSPKYLRWLAAIMMLLNTERNVRNISSAGIKAREQYG